MRTGKSSEKRAAATSADPRWQSVATRDSKADGTFVYSVKSTGVYCRPSCAARLARAENVQFHVTPADAEAAGFRRCRRCKPDEPSAWEQHVAMVSAACRRIEDMEKAEPSLKELAALAHMSSFHFHRVFRAVTGVTPKRYAAAHRMQSVRQKLRSSKTVTEAIYDAGYNSNGRFYGISNEALGMTPAAFRAGGKDAEIHFAVGESSLGSILVAKSRRGICAILLGDDPERLVRDLEDRFPRADLIGGDRSFEELVAKVVGLVEDPSAGLDLPLDIRGTVFQQRVWQALRELPAGSTASYAEIAKSLGSPQAVRAVARACAANKIAIAIPCHRVVRSGGSLSGYRWGVERKRLLLEREASRPGPING